MKISWKTSLLAIGVLGLLAAVTVPDAMAGGRGHSGGASHGHVAPGSRSVHGRSGNLTRYDRGRFGGRNRDFRRPWYGDRFGRYGYGFYSSYGLPSYTYYPGCYGLCAPSCVAANSPCEQCAGCTSYPICEGTTCGFGDCLGGWGAFGGRYGYHRNRDGRPDGRGGEHRIGPVGHGGSSGMASHIASGGSRGSRR